MIQSFFNFLTDLTKPEELGRIVDTVLTGWWVYVAMFGIVFAETGLLLGFILPGDSLLFTLGVVAGTGKLNIYWLIGLLLAGAIIGDSTGYYLGLRTGPKIFSKPDSKLFKQDYIRRTQSFFERYGGKTVIFGRFIPIVRSFTAFMAGVGNMKYRTFLMFSVIGASVWVFAVTLAGYFLGNVPIVKNNFEKAIIIVIVLSFVPAILEFIHQKRKTHH